MTIKTCGTAYLPDAVLRHLHRCGDIDDRLRHSTTQRPGFMQMDRRHVAELRTPLTDANPFRIMVRPLFDRVVDPDRVDRRAPRLHLTLAPVNAGLVVDELTCKMQSTLTPGKPQVVARKGHQHRPHAEVDPAMGPQGTHAGIHERHSGASFTPGLQPLDIRCADAAHEGMEITEFNRGLILQLLDEMAVPVEP